MSLQVSVNFLRWKDFIEDLNMNIKFSCEAVDGT